jgi:pumilio homology domain family member 6
MSTVSLRKPKNKSHKSSKIEDTAPVVVKKGKKISVVNEKAESEQSESEFEDVSEFEDEVEEEGEGEGEENEGEASTEERSLNKKSKSESRQEAKKVKLERQSHRPHNDLVQNAKKLWEKVRRRDLPSSERAGPLKELFALLTGKFKEIIVKHDASRMIQTCVKYGNPEQRLQIANELKGAYAEISKSRYGKHIVKRLLQYCPSVRKSIVGEFRGQVGKLIRHADASSVLEEIYSEYANGRDRNTLLLEFYGPEFVLFQKRGESEPIPSLSEILQTCNQEKKEKIMKYLREALDGLVNKGSLQHTFIHRLMLEYVQNEETAKLQDWISTFEGQLVEILHTFEGARVVSKCIAVATAKQRKNILKSFKNFISKIAKEEYGHQVLLVAFAVIDDTVLMRSVIISELLKNLREFLEDKHASRLFLYLLATASESVNSVLSSQAVQLLKESVSSAASAGTSKKDAILRSSELRADLIEPLSDLICATEVEDIENDENSSFRFEKMIENSGKHALLLESVLALPLAFEKMMKGPACEQEFYNEADFRALMKKFARKCSVEQGRSYFEAIKPILKELIESEAAYIFAVLITSKPELKELLPKNLKSTNEHALALYQKL